MKKFVFAFGMVALMTAPAFAQKNKKATTKQMAAMETVPVAATKTAVAPVTSTSKLSAENLSFKEDVHDFGSVVEGENADFDFVFTNTGKEPIIIERAQPSCGCTASEWTKEPILPGKTGFVRASYHTQGRPGPFTKNVTVLSNAGAKVLTFKGEVEKAPTGSVPEQNSIIKTN